MIAEVAAETIHKPNQSVWYCFALQRQQCRIHSKSYMRELHTENKAKDLGDEVGCH